MVTRLYYNLVKGDKVVWARPETIYQRFYSGGKVERTRMKLIESTLAAYIEKHGKGPFKVLLVGGGEGFDCRAIFDNDAKEFTGISYIWLEVKKEARGDFRDRKFANLEGRNYGEVLASAIRQIK
jgi:hypothetical protein